MLRNSIFSDVKLSKLSEQMILGSARNGVQVEKEYLENVQKICTQILQCRKAKNRLELTNFFEAVDRALNAKYLDFKNYNGEHFREDLERIRDQFNLDIQWRIQLIPFESSLFLINGNASLLIGSRTKR